MIVGSCCRYMFEIVADSAPFLISSGFENIGYMIGALFSEWYCKKFGMIGMVFVWIGIFVSGLCILPVYFLSGSVWVLYLGLFAMGINNGFQAIDIIIQVKCLREIIKRNNKSYCLSVLFSLNQMGWVLIFIMQKLGILGNYLLFFFGICLSIFISYKYKDRSHSIITDIREIRMTKMVMSFSAFVVQFFAFGLMLSAFRMSNFVLGDDASTSISSSGYLIGAFLVNFLASFKDSRVITVIFVVVPVMFLGLSVLIYEEKIVWVIVLAGWFVNLGTGMMEVLNVRLIVLKTSRPEFFIGMFYFISYLTDFVIYCLYL